MKMKFRWNGEMEIEFKWNLSVIEIRFKRKFVWIEIKFVWNGKTMEMKWHVNWIEVNSRYFIYEGKYIDQLRLNDKAS